MSSHPALICLDIDGNLTSSVTGSALPGAVDAVQRLRQMAPVRLVTNTTSLSHGRLTEHLRSERLLEDAEHLVTPARSARRVLPTRGHDAGLLLIEEGARADFAWFREDPEGPAVLLGTEGHTLRIRDLQPAFRRLLDGAAFYTLQRNRYFRSQEQLVTDLGPVAAFLAYASGVEPQTLGKPSPLLFDALAGELGASRSEVLMVGDDAEFDVSASVRLGMGGVLVRTGKYRKGDETRVDPAPTAVLDSVADLPRWIETQF